MEEANYKVYQHINKINGKRYIGITRRDPNKRFGYNGHGYRECPYFWNAIQAYGWDEFDHEILYDNLTYEQACKKEVELIAKYDATNPENGYNISRGGDGVDPLISKTLWLRDGFREYASECMKEAWTDPEKRRARSEKTKERWQNEEYKNKVTKAIVQTVGRSVVCLETNEVFETMKDAEVAHHVNHSNIVRSIKTGYRCGGYHWAYCENVS